MGWYEVDSFLKLKSPANYDPAKPGNVGGVKPSPKTVADPPEPKVIETHCTDETMIERDQTAKDGDTVSPVATDAGMGEDMIEMPGRLESGEYEGSPELYEPGDGADNLFTPKG